MAKVRARHTSSFLPVRCDTDVGPGPVRNQARNVLRALTEDDLLEKLRKEKQVAALSRQGERYERTYTSQMQSAFRSAPARTDVVGPERPADDVDVQ